MNNSKNILIIILVAIIVAGLGFGVYKYTSSKKSKKSAKQTQKLFVKAPDEVKAGAEFEVKWSGPDQKGDYLALSKPNTTDYKNYQYTKKGSPATLRAPDTPGIYKIYYYSNKKDKSLTKAEIKVKPVEANLKTPEKVHPGKSFTVSWEGPNNKGDYITIVKKGADEGSYNSYKYTKKGKELTLKAPKKLGKYEVRYVTGQSDKTLAKKELLVTKSSVSLSAPKQIEATKTFTVNWTGPAGNNHLIAIADKKSETSSYFSSSIVKFGNNEVSLVAPSNTNKDYELRYISEGKKILKTKDIEVTSTPQ